MIIKQCICSLVARFILGLGLYFFKIDGSVSILQVLLGVLGVLYSIAISTAISIDLYKIKNKSHRLHYRDSIQSVAYGLTIDLIISALLIILALGVPEKQYCKLYISSVGIASGVLSLLGETKAFIKLLKFKNELVDKLIEEESGRN